LPAGRAIVILPKRTAPFRHGGDPTSIAPPPADRRADSSIAKAFHDLHGPSLHGFALLVSLGNTRRAEAAAGEALAAGGRQAEGLRHPERAAAWLRARVLHSLRSGRLSSVTDAARWTALASLGVEEPVYEGLAALSVEGRAALTASAIERFESIDIETILGASPSATRRLVAQARADYLAAVGHRASVQTDEARGPLATRVQDVASRAMTAEASR
jgi:DNA-directed RNA polymerase specialized sigma24 family protein